MKAQRRVEVELQAFTTSELDVCVCVRACVGGQRHAPVALLREKRRGTHCVGGWVGLRGGLHGCRSSCLRRDPIPGPPIP
jgi:hypothetical protein